jgi:hypothetical protein
MKMADECIEQFSVVLNAGRPPTRTHAGTTQLSVGTIGKLQQNIAVCSSCHKIQGMNTIPCDISNIIVIGSGVLGNSIYYSAQDFENELNYSPAFKFGQNTF